VRCAVSPASVATAATAVALRAISWIVEVISSLPVAASVMLSATSRVSPATRRFSRTSELT